MYTLHHGDCLEVMQQLPDKSIDAIITDPPYGTTACKWDSVIPFDPMWQQLKRIIKPCGAIVLFGSQPFASALVMSNPKWFKHERIWDKRLAANFLNAKRCPLLVHEAIYIFSQAGASNGSKINMRYNPIMQPRDKPRIIHTNVGIENHKNPKYFHLLGRESKTYALDARYPTSIIQVGNTDRRKAYHPTQKPVALMEYLIKTYSNEHDTILDFTMGSGSTGAACMNTGRRFIGIEKDATYFQVAQARIEQAAQARQLSLEEAI
jgi:site-specific DNA-methyltransferase (adenine-specific)